MNIIKTPSRIPTDVVRLDLDVVQLVGTVRQRVAVLVAHVLRPGDVVVAARHVTGGARVVVEDLVEPAAVEYLLLVVIVGHVDQLELGVVVVVVLRYRSTTACSVALQ